MLMKENNVRDLPLWSIDIDLLECTLFSSVHNSAGMLLILNTLLFLLLRLKKQTITTMKHGASKIISSTLAPTTTTVIEMAQKSEEESACALDVSLASTGGDEPGRDGREVVASGSSGSEDDGTSSGWVEGRRDNC